MFDIRNISNVNPRASRRRRGADDMNDAIGF